MKRFLVCCLLAASAVAQNPRRYRQHQQNPSLGGQNQGLGSFQPNTGISDGSSYNGNGSPDHQQGHGLSQDFGRNNAYGAQQGQVESGGYGGSQAGGMPYNFNYAVKDNYGNDYAQEENSDGALTRGTYRVLLPDGRTQTVTYTSDDQTGFLADVQYQGLAQSGQGGQGAYGQASGQARGQGNYGQLNDETTYGQGGQGQLQHGQGSRGFQGPVSQEFGRSNDQAGQGGYVQGELQGHRSSEQPQQQGNWGAMTQTSPAPWNSQPESNQQTGNFGQSVPQYLARAEAQHSGFTASARDIQINPDVALNNQGAQQQRVSGENGNRKQESWGQNGNENLGNGEGAPPTDAPRYGSAPPTDGISPVFNGEDSLVADNAQPNRYSRRPAGKREVTDTKKSQSASGKTLQKENFAGIPKKQYKRRA